MDTGHGDKSHDGNTEKKSVERLRSTAFWEEPKVVSLSLSQQPMTTSVVSISPDEKAIALAHRRENVSR